MGSNKPVTPIAARAINAAGTLLRGVGMTLPRIEARDLLHQVQRKTGLDDFGDSPILEALPVMVDSINRQPSVSTVGRIFVRHILMQRLSNRLQIEAAHAADPAIAAQPIEQPVFIAAPPRTGTTILHRLLAIDPRNRTPKQWEMDRPAPPCRREPRREDPRIKEVKRDIAVLSWLAPVFKTIHEIGAEQPEECINLFANDLTSIWFLIGFDLPEYREWLYGYSDQARLYRSHKAQLLQAGQQPRRWVLKAPAHLYGLAGLLEVYPDARIIQTHRDLPTCIASLASLFFTMRAAFHEELSAAAVGTEIAELMERWIGRAMEVREQVEHDPKMAARFVDVPYHELVADPIPSIRSIYEQLSIELDSEVESEMRRFLETNRQHKHGRHQYSLEQFSLDETELRRRFSRFNEC